MLNATELLHGVRNILFREWDPIGVNDDERCSDEYDSYAPEIVRLLFSGADERKLASRLSEFQRVSMSLPVIDEEHDRRTARRLLALVANAEPGKDSASRHR